MGAVISFPEVRRTVRELPLQPPCSATVIILPAVRVERAGGAPPDTQAESPESPKPPTGGKRRRRASRT
jgi:hypothetical protein